MSLTESYLDNCMRPEWTPSHKGIFNLLVANALLDDALQLFWWPNKYFSEVLNINPQRFVFPNPQAFPRSLLSQEIAQSLQVYLCHRHFNSEFILFTFVRFNSPEKLSAKSWNNSFVLFASEESVGLACPRLSVCEQAAIVALPRVLKHVHS